MILENVFSSVTWTIINMLKENIVVMYINYEGLISQISQSDAQEMKIIELIGIIQDIWNNNRLLSDIFKQNWSGKVNASSLDSRPYGCLG